MAVCVCAYYCRTYYKAVRVGEGWLVCVYHCSTYYKAVRGGLVLADAALACHTAVPITKLSITKLLAFESHMSPPPPPVHRH